jgi:hypothetical protein
MGERVSSSTSSWGEGGVGLEEQQPRSLVMRLMVGGTVLGGFEGFGVLGIRWLRVLVALRYVWCVGRDSMEGPGNFQICLVCGG